MPGPEYLCFINHSHEINQVLNYVVGARKEKEEDAKSLQRVLSHFYILKFLLGDWLSMLVFSQL